MKAFIDRFSGLVKGTISGFDRIVFKGLILPLMSSTEVMSFCRSRRILNKDYKQWMMKQTSELIENAERYAKENLILNAWFAAATGEALPGSGGRHSASRNRQPIVTSTLVSALSCLQISELCRECSVRNRQSQTGTPKRNLRGYIAQRFQKVLRGASIHSVQ